jgi:hypothetical protein
MAKTLPKKWFPVHGQAKICLRKVDRWAEMHAKTGISPYFGTWEEAHAYMLDKATKKRNTLVRDLASIERHLAKVQVMSKPDA